MKKFKNIQKILKYFLFFDSDRARTCIDPVKVLQLRRLFLYGAETKVELHFIAVNSTTNMALWWDSNLLVIVV